MDALPLLTDARSLAAQGAWAEVCRLLSTHRAVTRTVPELGALLAEAYLRTGEAADACRTLRELIPQLQRGGDTITLRRVANLRGAAHFELGELEDALAAFEQTLTLGLADSDDLAVARATNNLALIANIHGDHEAALANYRVAIPAYQRLGFTRGLAESHHNIAITYRDTDHLELADEHECRALEYAREAGEERLVAIAMVGRAEIQLRTGDAALAEATALRASEDLARIPDPARRADALRLASVARSAQDDDMIAISLLDTAVSEARGCGATLIEAECLRSRAECRMRRGMRDQAMEDADRALSLFNRLKASRCSEEMEQWILQASETQQDRHEN